MQEVMPSMFDLSLVETYSSTHQWQCIQGYKWLTTKPSND